MVKVIKKNFLLFLIILVIIYLIIGSFLNLYYPCIFNSITGLYCPGCGVTRMIKSMIELDFYQAFRYNQLLFIFSPFILFLMINYIYCTFKNKKSIYKKIPLWVWNTLLVITIIYWILRNIIPYLAPTVV